ncbi:MAG: hypothetical protein U0793_19680 [Gemmataceae bacterium]
MALSASRASFAAPGTKWYAAHASAIDTDGRAMRAPISASSWSANTTQRSASPAARCGESGRDLRPRFTIKGVMGVMDAQVLPNGRVLLAENSANKITERDQTGAITWEYGVPGNPITAQRLPNGNTFIAMYNSVMEITPEKKILYNLNRGPTFYIFSASKLRNGNVLAMTAQGVIMEFDPFTNKDVRTINLGPAGGWCSVEAMPNGHYLVATMNNSQVREIDTTGKALMTINMGGVFRATRLPNGNVLAASMTTRAVAEFDRGGNKRWEKICDGRPWSVRYR